MSFLITFKQRPLFYLAIPLVLALSGFIAQPILAELLKHFRSQTLLRTQLCGIVLFELLMLKFYSISKLFFILLAFVGVACHGLYPMLLLHSFLLGLEYDEDAIPICFQQYVKSNNHVVNTLRRLQGLSHMVQVTTVYSVLSACLFGYSEATFYLISCYAPIIFYAFSNPEPKKNLEERLKKLPGGQWLSNTVLKHKKEVAAHLATLRETSAIFRAGTATEVFKRFA